MSENLGKLVKQYKNRSQKGYYVLAFIGGFILIWILGFTFTNPIDGSRIILVIVGGPISIVAPILILVLIYTILDETAKSRLKRCLDQVLIEWKMKAVEDTIKTIETVAPVPLIHIETYSHNILYQWLATSYPSLNLQKLRIGFPNTVFILQQLLSQKPFLGTYY